MTRTVYVEYAFLENVILDGALLLFALKSSGVRLTWRWLVASLVGGLVAVLFPLLSLPAIVGWIYKLSTGALLPLLASGGAGRRKTWLCVGLFFAISFCVAGGTFAAANFLPMTENGYLTDGLPLPLITVLFALTIVGFSWTIKKYRLHRSRADFFVDCRIDDVGVVKAKGFVDTGNLARVDGVPVCFAEPTIFARLIGTGEVRYATIKTVAGEKKIAVVKLKNLRITHGGQTHIIQRVYLSPSTALCGREYQLLLGVWAYG